MPQNDKNITDVSNYEELITYLDIRKAELEARGKKSYQRRYFFRRLPVFFSPGLVFFALSTVFIFFDQIGYEKIDVFLTSWNLFDGMLVSLSWLLFGVAALLLAFHSGSFQKKINTIFKSEKIKKTPNWLPSFGFLAKFVLTMLPLATFFTVISTEYPLLFGVTLFAAATIGSILLERTLGYTRRNERCYFYAKRAENLSRLFATKQKMGIDFNEAFILDVYKLNDDFQSSRYKDTITDTQYLSQQVESRIPGGKKLIQ